VKHYTAYTRYEKILLEQPDGTAKEILRAIDPLEIPEDTDSDSIEHGADVRDETFIHLDPPFYLHLNGELGIKTISPFGRASEVRSSKER